MPRRPRRRARESDGSYTAGSPEVRTEISPHPRNRDVSTLESNTYNIKRACDMQMVQTCWLAGWPGSRFRREALFGGMSGREPLYPNGMALMRPEEGARLQSLVPPRLRPFVEHEKDQEGVCDLGCSRRPPPSRHQRSNRANGAASVKELATPCCANRQ